MLTKTSDGVANGPRLKKALAGVIGGSHVRFARGALVGRLSQPGIEEGLDVVRFGESPDIGRWHAELPQDVDQIGNQMQRQIRLIVTVLEVLIVRRRHLQPDRDLPRKQPRLSTQFL